MKNESTPSAEQTEVWRIVDGKPVKFVHTVISAEDPEVVKKRDHVETEELKGGDLQYESYGAMNPYEVIGHSSIGTFDGTPEIQQSRLRYSQSRQCLLRLSILEKRIKKGDQFVPVSTQASKYSGCEAQVVDGRPTCQRQEEDCPYKLSRMALNKTFDVSFPDLP